MKRRGFIAGLAAAIGLPSLLKANAPKPTPDLITVRFDNGPTKHYQPCEVIVHMNGERLYGFSSSRNDYFVDARL